MDLTPIDKSRIRKIDGKKVSFGSTEHRYREFEKDLTPQADRIYHKICLDANKEGMSFHSIRGFAKRLKYGNVAIYKSLEMLKKWGLILYEKREDGYATQVLPVPNYDLMKQRHITIHVHTPTNLTPIEIADRLKVFDDAIKDPAQAAYRQTLETARVNFIKEFEKSKKT